MTLNDTWFAIETEQNGRPVLLRGRQHLKNLINTGDYVGSIEIVWTLKEGTDDGIPTLDENELMQKVENALVDTVEPDLQSVLSIVYTHNNQRTWIFYTKSTEDFGARLNEALSAFDNLPISIEADYDPDWKLYHGILRNNKLKVK